MLPVAVVPVKYLAGAKSRLAAHLPAAARAALVQRLLRRVLATLAASEAVAGRLVVSPDARVLALAAEAGAEGLCQRDEGLNAALEAARGVVGATMPMLVVAADLPLLTAAEVRGLLGRAPATPGLVIAPDAAEAGTNLLLLRPAGALPFQFGRDSFRRHVAAARAGGLTVEIYRSPGTTFDLDTPAQLDELRERHAALFRALALGADQVGLAAGGAA